jgi:dipeptidyl aminopeptidase/acylaminoacyl peptidase
MRSLRLVLCATCLTAVAPVWPTAQVRRPVTVDDLMQLRSIVDVELAPAGDRVAYVVSTPSLRANRHETALYVVPARGGAATRLAEDAQIFTPALPAPRLRWSPDGRTIAFLGVAGGGPQVFGAPSDGGASRALTTADAAVVAYEFAPDGVRLAYITRAVATPAAVTRAGTPDPPSRLWVQTPGEAARALTPVEQYVDSLSWAPDGREIAYSAAPVTGFLAPYSTRIYAVAADGSGRRVIVDRAGMNTSPQFSPDGSSIAFVSTNGAAALMAPRGLAVVSARGAAQPVRTFPLDGAWIGEMVWAADSRAIYVLMNEGTFAMRAQMFEMPIVRVAIADGRAEAIVSGRTVNYAMSLSRDGRTLAYRAIEGRTMGELFVQELDAGTRTQVTTINPELAALALGELRPVSWRSFDGMEIWGLLLTPADWDGKRRLGTLVYCHGGPIGGVTYGIFPQFAHTVGQIDPYPTEAFASAGYAVLFPMPRGGSGYGEAGHRAIVNAWGEADYQDIMAGVDYLIAQGIADADRLGVLGASYGGFMTNWIVTQTDRFKAASAGASISDLFDLYYLPDGGEVVVEYFKYPWQNRESYVAHSPLTFADRVKTPLLLQHGDRDPRVPLTNAQKFHRALKTLGKVVEFDLYPGGGHVLYQPVQQRESMRRNLEWFARWIDPRN